MQMLIRQPTHDTAAYGAELELFEPEVIGGCPVAVACEPLMRERDGRLWQALRVRVGRPALPRVTVLGPDGAEVPHERSELRGEGVARGVGSRTGQGDGTGGPNRDRDLAEAAPKPSAGVVQRATASARLLVPAVEQPTSCKVRLHFTEGDVDVPVTVAPQRRFTVHLVHHSHLDIGYTDPQPTVLREQLAYLDACLALARRSDDHPDDARFRWSVEALWVFERWAAQRDPATVREFLGRVAEGRFELTAMPFTLHTETCSVDELHELLRPARELRAAHGVPMTVAMQTDVPGMTVGCVDAMAGAGVRYLSVAHNWAGRSIPHHIGGERLPRLFRWQAPSGRSLLVWNTDTAHGWYMEGSFLGLHESYEDAAELLPAYLARVASEPYAFSVARPKFLLPPVDGPLDREPYPWEVLHLRVQGRLIDNAPPSDAIAGVVRRWNEEWTWPRLRLSRNEDFFADAERRHGDELQTFSGDWSDWWADGVGSAAQPLAAAREAQRAVATGQHLEGVARLLGADVDAVERPVQDAYRAISLFNEHTWGASNPWTVGDQGIDSGQAQWQWKVAHAHAGAERADELVQRAALRVGRTLGRGDGVLASIYAVNASGAARTDELDAFVPDDVVAAAVPLALRDARTGEPLAHEQRREASPCRRPGRHVRLIARDVPACGVARFDVVGEDAAPAASSATAPEPTVLENEHLRVEVDLARACIASIVDKASGRELVDDGGPLGFNAYLYDRYATSGRVPCMSSLVTAREGDLSLLASRDAGAHAALVDRRSTAVAEQLVYELRPAGAERLRVTLRLPHGVARLDVANELTKPCTDDKESAYFAFPFAVEQPVIRCEVTGGVAGPGLDAVPGSAEHMRAVRRWVSLEQTGGGAAVAWATHDAPLVQIGGIALPYAPFPQTLPGDPRPATLYSWVHNNLWDTNFPAGQSFQTRFRYSVAAGNGPGAALGVATAAAGSRPLVAIVTADARPAPAALSLAAVDDPRVRVVGFAPAPGGGVVLRLQSFAEETVAVTVRLPPGRERATPASFGGEPAPAGAAGLPVADGAVRVELAACSTAALLLE